MRKKIVVTLLLLIVKITLFSQPDTSLINTLTKLQLIPEIAAWNNCKLNIDIVNKVLKAPIPIKILQSDGFDDFIFTFIEMGEIDIVIEDLRIMGGCKGFILAIDTLNIEIYRIAGFYENDNIKFLHYLKRQSYPFMRCAKSFSKNYFIEGVDLKCLYHAAKKKSRDTNKYPCLKYCGEPINVY